MTTAIPENKEFGNVFVQIFGEGKFSSTDSNSLSYKISKMRMFGPNESPLFIAKEVGEILGLQNINSTLASEIYTDKYVERSRAIEGHPQKMNMLTELGLYTVVCRSNSEFARQFMEFITAVLKDLRLRGVAKLSELQKEFEALSSEHTELTTEVADSRRKIGELGVYEVEAVAYRNQDPEDLNNLIQEHYMKTYGVYMVKPSMATPKKKEKKKEDVKKEKKKSEDLEFLKTAAGIAGSTDEESSDDESFNLNPATDDTCHEQVLYFCIGEPEKYKHAHFKLARVLRVLDKKMLDLIREELAEHLIPKPGPKLVRKKVYHCSLEQIIEAREKILRDILTTPKSK